MRLNETSTYPPIIVQNRQEYSMPLSGQTRRTPIDPDILLEAEATYQSVRSTFLQERDTMPLQYFTTFLLVALNEGLSVKEYAELAQVSTSVMSRHLLDIGDRNRHMTEGFGLVTSRPHPMELRKHEVFLTPKGRALLHNMIRIQRLVRGGGRVKQQHGETV
jgi:DNA-binding MarR family transcriptional regulator